MKCKCGKDAELMQPNLFNPDGSVPSGHLPADFICLDCFNKLGDQESTEPHYEDGLFYASQMGGFKNGIAGTQITIEDFER